MLGKQRRDRLEIPSEYDTRKCGVAHTAVAIMAHRGSSFIRKAQIQQAYLSAGLENAFLRSKGESIPKLVE
ncbi:MAG: hypothetical protein KAY24_04915, partial [Candidatus Eisenbacteria sp.]|nr:hypothetical protein [Candidatus Eisenbacteria bacterium]